MKGELITITTIYNEDLTVNCYQAVIDFEKKPKLSLGKCEVNQ